MPYLQGGSLPPPQLVVTATLVEPRGLPPLSVKRTRTRAVAGASATGWDAATKIEKVGVA